MSRLYRPAIDEAELDEIANKLEKRKERIAKLSLDMTEVAIRLHSFYSSKKEISKAEELSRRALNTIRSSLERERSDNISLTDRDTLRLEALVKYWEGIAKASKHAVSSAKQERERALKEKAEAHMRAGQYDEAIKVLQIMIDAERKANDAPAMAATLRNIAEVMRKKGDSEGSLDYFQRAAEIEPHAWFDVGFMLGEMRQFEKSIAAYDKLLEKVPDNANAWNNKGWAYENLLDFPKALKCYKKALTLNDRLAKSWEGQGSALWRLGRLEQAANSFEMALGIEPNNQYTLINLTALYNDGLKDYAKAVHYAQRALDANPLDLSARSNLAEILVSARRYEEARDHAKKVLESDDNPSRKIAMYFTIASSYFLEGNMNEGAKYLKTLKDYRESLQSAFTSEWSYEGISNLIANSNIPEDHKTNLLKAAPSIGR